MQAWEQFLKIQEAEIGPVAVQKWLKSLKIVKYDACNLYLEAKDAFQALWFEEHIRKKAAVHLLNNNNRKIKVHLSVANAQQKQKTKKAINAPVMQAPAFTLKFDQLDPSAAFDTFVASANNEVPFNLIARTAGIDRSPPELSVFNPIYLYGSQGSGKTLLLMSLCRTLQDKGLRVLYSRAETFTEHVVSAIRAGEMGLFRQTYRQLDVLCLDDIHVFSKKAATQEEFFHTFNTLHMAGKQIILSANCPPNELQHIEPRLISRFEWGIALPLETLAGEDLKAALHKKAEAFKFPLHTKIADYLIETFSLNPKSLMKALNALILRTHLNESLSRLSSGALTIASVKHTLADLIYEAEKEAITPDKIIRTVAEHFGIRPEDIGKGQTRESVLPRQIAMYTLRKELKLPFMKIGDLFQKDHSTVMSSIKQIEKGIAAGDSDIGDAVREILKKLKS